MRLWHIVVGILLTCILGYFMGIYTLGYLIENGYTNSRSDVITIENNEYIDIPSENRQVHKYINENPNKSKNILEAYTYLHGTGKNGANRFPKNNGGIDFVLKGFKNRKSFISEVEKQSEILGIDPDIVMSSVLGEQIRIANKGARGKLKNIVINGTPTLFRSYDVSLGIGGIKLSTARQIRKDAILYGYGEQLQNDEISEEKLIANDEFNARYATYLVKNIIHRRSLSGYDISQNPGVVGTLYNMGNDKKKEPNGDPKIGGSVINIGGNDYVYGGISMAVYRYLKIYE